MTSRCKQQARCKRHQIWCGIAISSLFALAAVLPMPAFAQDGAKIPPPPHLKKHFNEDNSPDAEFHSPLKRGGFNNVEARRNLKRQFPDFQNRENGGKAEDNASLTPPMFPGGAPGFSTTGGNGAVPTEHPGNGFAARRPGGNGPLNGQVQFGANGMRRQGPMMGGGLMGTRKQLDLTPLNLTQEQKQHIRQIRQGARVQAKEARQELQQRQLALRSLLFSPDASDAEIKQARRALRTAQDRMDDINLNDLLQVRGVLTREQKQMLPQLVPAAANGANGPNRVNGSNNPNAPNGQLAGGPAGDFPAGRRARALRRMQMEAAPQNETADRRPE